MLGSELIYALCLVFFATVAAAFPSNIDTLVKQYGEMYLKDGIVPQVAKTHAFMKEGKVHMHVDLLGITHEFLLEPTSVFSQDLIISVVKGGGVVENLAPPKQYSYHVVDERNVDVSGTAIVHDNGFNKVLMYTIGETEYTLDGFGLEFDSGYSYFYAVKDVKVDPNLKDEARTPPSQEGGRRSLDSESASTKYTRTSPLLITSDELPEVSVDFGHHGHAGHMGGHLGRKRRAVQGLKVAEIVVDLDAEYVAQFDSMNLAIIDIADHINAVNQLYLPSGIIHTIKSVTVRTADAPQYTAQDPYDLLDEVYSTWAGNGDDDLTMLFTGRSWSSGTVGVAYLGTICWQDWNIGVSQLLFTRLRLAVTRVQLIAHEFGHNWGCNHVEATEENKKYVMYPSVLSTDTTFGPACTAVLVSQQQKENTCLSLMASEEACAISPCERGSCSVLHVGATGASETVCTCPSGYTGDICEVDIDECANNACTANSLRCDDDVNSYRCVCAPGFDGEFCENNIDDCAVDPCINGNCVDMANGFECICDAGWEGALCKDDKNDCDPNPCANSGTCTDIGVEAFTCTCVAGYDGLDCSNEVNNCNSQSCNMRGTCASTVNAYTCTCDTGFRGDDCEIDIDECLDNPCVNGQCSDGINDYTCACVLGWDGKSCDNNIDDCAANPCQNNAVCTDAVNDYSCACVGGFFGKNCEFASSGCAAEPCAHGGACTDVGDMGGFLCDCTGTGYNGANCEEDIIDCVEGYCQSNGICTEGVNLATCECAAGYTGTNCEIDNCSVMCLNGASCTGTADNVGCQCADGYEGANCADEINECNVFTPCANGAVCTDLVNGYECTCAPGFSGETCENNINDCDPNPCLNGANCVDKDNAYECVCNAGYKGANCEVNSNDCDHQLCQNGATCEDGVDSFTCNCAASGFTGEFCEENIDDCINEPCGEHGFQCIDGVNSFMCICKSGFEGPTCLVDIDECVTLNRCQNGATCTDKPNDYECDCAPGYGGKDCQVEIDNCIPSPCLHQGVCTSALNSYTCECADGYTAPDCEIDIDECVGVVCGHGTCEDKVNSYQCVCEVGYSGDLCDVNIDDCVGVTCANGGICVDGVNTHTCQCESPFEGDNCEIDPRVGPVDKCATYGECQNGGKCVLDDAGEPMCECASAYVGTFCEAEMDCPVCENRGRCIRNWRDYTKVCMCRAGFYGPTCSENSNAVGKACNSYPCGWRGQCVNDKSERGNFKCECYAGWTGRKCRSMELFEGEECIEGRRGQHCEIDINECVEDNPCVNGRCRNRRKYGQTYTCRCNKGWKGTNCDVPR